MAWRLDDGGSDGGAGPAHRPYKFLMPDRKKHPELENSLALSLVTYGSVAVSVWMPAKLLHLPQTRLMIPVFMPLYRLVWRLKNRFSRMAFIPQMAVMTPPPLLRHLSRMEQRILQPLSQR